MTIAADDEAALDRLLLALVGTPGAPILDEIEKARPEFDALGPTEREAIVAARMGQGRFRSDVLAAWSSACAVTGVTLPDLLRAGHIQRWCDSNNVDRLSAENGLPLLASLDAAFESLLLTFDDDGAMRVAPHAEEHLSILMHGTSATRLRKVPSARQRLFLAEHRKRFTAQNGSGRTAEAILKTTK